jgi:hypothetical protein
MLPLHILFQGYGKSSENPFSIFHSDIVANAITLGYILASEGVFLRIEYIVCWFEASPALLAEAFVFDTCTMHNDSKCAR